MTYVREQIAGDYVNAGGIFIIGRSLGGAVAAEILNDERNSKIIDGAILENTFTSIPDMVDHIFVLVKYVKGIILRIGWYTKDIIPKVSTPILFVTGDKDEIVPYEHTLKLYEAAKSGKSALTDILIIENGTHNDTWHKDLKTYLQKVMDFCEKAHSISARKRQQE